MKHTFSLVNPWPNYMQHGDGLPPEYAGLAANPPVGCVYEEKVWGQYPGLRCEVEAPGRIEAIASVAGAVWREHGIWLYDVGIEKLSEWSGDDPALTAEEREADNTWARDITAQMLLTGIDRAMKLGLDDEAILRVVRTALGDVTP